MGIGKRSQQPRFWHGLFREMETLFRGLSITENLEATVAQQQNEIRNITAALEQQAAQIQQVSNRLDLAAPQLLAGNK